jgi:hypothetical protein
MTSERKNTAMTANEILKQWKKDNPQVENIVIFVSDALRWDHLPPTIAQRGITFKTIAASAFTASSFPSIISGLSPNHHGVVSFFNKLPKDLPTLLNTPGYNTSLWLENTWIDAEHTGQSELHQLLNCKNAVSLEHLTTPFIYLEDEKGGHCPYGWTEDDIYKEIECRKFFKDYGKKSNSELRQRYQAGINRSVNEFEKRLRILEKRNLLDTTLILFLSDHGELLGEYGGIIGHGFPTTPEIAYVPTVLMHPNLPAGLNFENEGVLRHIDLYPTIAELLNKKTSRNVDGISLFSTEKIPTIGITYYNTEIRMPIITYQLTEKSIWDKTGGYLFREGSNILFQLLYGIYDITISQRVHGLYLRGQLQQKKFKMIKNYGTILKNMCRSPIRYSSPGFNLEKAERMIQAFSETKMYIDEKQKIKNTIGRLKQEGKI